MCETVLCVTKSATKPPNAKTWACGVMNHQEILIPITPTGLNAIMKFTGLDVVAYVAKGCSNHSPGPMEMFKTEADDKSISNYDPSGRPILLIPKAQITMQGIQVPCLSRSTFYHGPKLSELLDHIFTRHPYLIDAHGKTSLLGFHKVTLDSRQSVLKSSKPSFGWHT